MLNRRTSSAVLGVALALPAASRADESLEAKVDAYIQPCLRTNNFSGAVLIARDGRVLVRKGYGYANQELQVPNTPEHRFHVASVSKSFTAAAILLLEQRGRLRVEDPLEKYLPDYPNGQRITIHQLLAHTSGIANANSIPGYDEKSRFPQRLADVLALFKDKPLEFEPGTRYRYSNSNYNVLAAVIEQASGESYGAFLRGQILDPLGLRDTGHDGDPGTLIPRRAQGYSPTGRDGLLNAPYLDWSIKTGNGSLYSTVDDLYHWAQALCGDALLDAPRRQKMFTEHTEGVGYGWFIRKGRHPSVGLGGRSPGFVASVLRFLDEDVVVVVLSNLYSSIGQSMAPDIAAIAFGEERAPPVPSTPVPVAEASLTRYPGRYQFGPDFGPNPNAIAEVRREDASLLLRLADGGTSFLIPLAEDRFLDRAFGGQVRFETDAAGRPSALVWNFGRDYRAPRLP